MRQTTVIEKAIKLKAKSEETSNPSEAEIAKVKLRSLLQKYNLTEKDLYKDPLYEVDDAPIVEAPIVEAPVEVDVVEHHSKRFSDRAWDRAWNIMGYGSLVLLIGPFIGMGIGSMSSAPPVKVKSTVAVVSPVEQPAPAPPAPAPPVEDDSIGRVDEVRSMELKNSAKLKHIPTQRIKAVLKKFHTICLMYSDIWYSEPGSEGGNGGANLFSERWNLRYTSLLSHYEKAIVLKYDENAGYLRIDYAEYDEDEAKYQDDYTMNFENHFPPIKP